jgi:hypothetical protein
MADETKKKIKFHCNSCGRETNHEIVGEHRVKDTTYVQIDPHDERSESIWAVDMHQMLSCLGCDEVTYRHQHYFSEDMDAEFNERTGKLEAVSSHEEQFPSRQDRSPPDWVREFSTSDQEYRRELASLFDEVYAARGRKANRLAAIGARTALDILFTQQVGDEGRFDQRLARLVEKLRLDKGLVDAANSVVGIGNAAAHRGVRPNDDQLSDLLDLVEEIIKAVYVTPEEQEELQQLLASKAEKIKLATPPRPRKADGRDRAAGQWETARGTGLAFWYNFVVQERSGGIMKNRRNPPFLERPDNFPPSPPSCLALGRLAGHVSPDIRSRSWPARSKRSSTS